MGASGVNWNNVPHEEILREINGGAGAAQLNAAADSYRRISEVLREADRDLRSALAAAGASWEGRAADGMTAAATPLATWADEADQLTLQTGASTEAFGEQFADTRWSLPAAVSVPSGSWVDGTGLSAVPGVTTDRERAEAAADAAQQEAARRMEAYDNASYETVRTQYFAEPPAVVIEVPPPSAGAGSGARGTATAAGGPSNTGGYIAPGGYTAPAAVIQPPPASGGGAAPGNRTAPNWSPPATTTPSVTVPPPGGTGPGGSGAPGLPPGVPGLPARGTPPGGPGAGGGFGPGGYRPGFGPGGHGPGGHSQAGHPPGGSGALAGFRDDGSGQRGPAGGAGVADPEGRAGLAGRAGGSAGGTGLGPVGTGSRRAEDLEHRRPNYLVETEDIWGDGTRVAPPVIGDHPPR